MFLSKISNTNIVVANVDTSIHRNIYVSNFLPSSKSNAHPVSVYPCRIRPLATGRSDGGVAISSFIFLKDYVCILCFSERDSLTHTASYHYEREKKMCRLACSNWLYRWKKNKTLGGVRSRNNRIKRIYGRFMRIVTH
jgi:hypothetical protein